MAADPSTILEVLRPFTIKQLALSFFIDSEDLYVTILEVEHLEVFEVLLHPANPNFVPPLVETLQSELLPPG